MDKDVVTEHIRAEYLRQRWFFSGCLRLGCEANAIDVEGRVGHGLQKVGHQAPIGFEPINTNEATIARI